MSSTSSMEYWICKGLGLKVLSTCLKLRPRGAQALLLPEPSSKALPLQSTPGSLHLQRGDPRSPSEFFSHRKPARRDLAGSLDGGEIVQGSAGRAATYGYLSRTKLRIALVALMPCLTATAERSLPPNSLNAYSNTYN